MPPDWNGSVSKSKCKCMLKRYYCVLNRELLCFDIQTYIKLNHSEFRYIISEVNFFILNLLLAYQNYDFYLVENGMKIS